jgi:hypothetical protein
MLDSIDSESNTFRNDFQDIALPPSCFSDTLPTMQPTFEDAYPVVKSLAKDFDANKSDYFPSLYHESEVRKDFIDKFLIAPGWDKGGRCCYILSI